jgi:hypothetical protein
MICIREHKYQLIIFNPEYLDVTLLPLENSHQTCLTGVVSSLIMPVAFERQIIFSAVETIYTTQTFKHLAFFSGVIIKRYLTVRDTF